MKDAIELADTIRRTSTIYDLNHYTLLHIMDYLSLPDVISCETLGHHIVEAAETHYAQNYKSVSISPKITMDVNHYEWVDVAPARTFWQMLLRFLSINNERTSVVEQCRTILKRIGPHIQRLYVVYGEYSIEDIAVICDLVREHCVALRGLHHIGPFRCSAMGLSRFSIPKLHQLEELSFHNLKDHTDTTISKYLTKCESTLTTLTLSEMRLTGHCLRNTGPLLRTLTLRRNKTLKISKLVRCVKASPLLQDFNLEHYTKLGYTHINIAKLVDKMRSVHQLTLRGHRFESFAILSQLENLVAMDLAVANVLEMNRMLTSMPDTNNIERLALTIEFALSDEAVSGFGKFHKLNLLRLNFGVDSVALEGIFRHLSNCKFLTSLELISFNEDETDVGPACTYLQRLSWLKIVAHKNVKNLTHIAKLPDLRWFEMYLSSCRCETYVQPNSADVNELLQLLAKKNELHVLCMRLHHTIQLTNETIALFKLFTKLVYVKYRGFLQEHSFFYGLGVLENLLDLTYVYSPIVGETDTGLNMDLEAMKCLMWTARNIRRLTIVTDHPKAIQQQVRALAEIRSGVKVRALDAEPRINMIPYYKDLGRIRKSS